MFPFPFHLAHILPNFSIYIWTHIFPTKIESYFTDCSATCFYTCIVSSVSEEQSIPSSIVGINFLTSPPLLDTMLLLISFLLKSATVNGLVHIFLQDWVCFCWINSRSEIVAPKEGLHRVRYYQNVH